MNKKDLGKLFDLKGKNGVISKSSSNMLHFSDVSSHIFFTVPGEIDNFASYSFPAFVRLFEKEKIGNMRTNIEFNDSTLKVTKFPPASKPDLLPDSKDYQLLKEEQEEIREYKELSVVSSGIIQVSALQDMAENGVTSALEAFPDMKDIYVFFSKNAMHLVSFNVSSISYVRVNLDKMMDNHDILSRKYSVNSDSILNFIRIFPDECLEEAGFEYQLFGKDDETWLKMGNNEAYCYLKMTECEIPFALPSGFKSKGYIHTEGISEKYLKKVIAGEKKKLPSALQTNFGVKAGVTMNEILIGERRIINGETLEDGNIAEITGESSGSMQSGFVMTANDLLRLLKLGGNISIMESDKAFRLDNGKEILFVHK